MPNGLLHLMKVFCSFSYLLSYPLVNSNPSFVNYRFEGMNNDGFYQLIVQNFQTYL